MCVRTILVSAVWLFTLASLGSNAEESGVLIASEHAGLTLDANEISVGAAERVAQACVEYAKEHKVSVAVIILSPSGALVYAYRMDGKRPIEVDTAWRKAKTVLYMRTSTRAMIARYGQDMQATMFELGQFPFTGGLPIVFRDQLIGAIGVGGARGEVDEQCAFVALEAVIGPQPAPVPGER